MTKRGKLIKYAQAKVPDARNVEHTATVSIFEHHPGYFTLYLDHIQPPLPEREGEMMGGTRELAEERFGHFAVGPITEGQSQDIRKQSREAMLAGSMLSALPFEKRAEYLKRMGQSQGNPQWSGEVNISVRATTKEGAEETLREMFRRKYPQTEINILRTTLISTDSIGYGHFSITYRTRQR